jgi:guanylate kinase
MKDTQQILEDNRVWEVPSLENEHFVVFSGPSAGGKTTTSALVARHVDASSLLVKHRNRPIRPGEVADVDYHFVVDNWFETSLENKILLAYEVYYGNRYALSQMEAASKRSHRTVFILIFNPKLALLFKQYYKRSTLFFAAPQPPEVLRERLSKRGSAPQDIALRQRYLEMELSVADQLNGFVNTSLSEEEQWVTIRKTIAENCPTIASSLRCYRAEADA